MIPQFRTLLVTLLYTSIPLSIFAAQAEIAQVTPNIDFRAQQLLNQMTLEQKIGQMIQAEIANVSTADIKKYRLGSVLNGGGSFPKRDKAATVSDWLALADELHAASISKPDQGIAVPLIWGTDAVHGHNNVRGATLFPHNIGLGAANDPELIERIGQAVASEVYATGIDWAFAPTIAVARDDRWGRTYESFSEDPVLVRKYAEKMVKGLQGRLHVDDQIASGHVIATAKHFLGDGGTAEGRDQGNAVYEQAELLRLHGQGYESAITAGVQTVMASFSSVNGEKMHGNKNLLTGVLKGTMGFQGFVISDWNGIGQVPGCSNDSCAKAINAGIDMLMAPEDWKALYQNTLNQVKAGEIPQSRIDDAVLRILRVKLRYGVFEKKAPSIRSQLINGQTVVGSAAHRALAREAVRKSLVLLKNDGALLPLKANSRVLVLGDGADSIAKQAGGWSVTWQGTGNSNADFPGATSILMGIKEVVRTAGGVVSTTWDNEKGELFDVAVVVFGENPYAEGEGDRESLIFSDEHPDDLALLKRLKAAGIPVVSVFLSGRPMWVNPELNASNAFVAAWLPGTEGAGVADMLFGDSNGTPRYEFSGRLSFSWPGSSEPRPVNVDESSSDILFPFGFGLRLSDRSLSSDLLSEERPLSSRGDRELKIFDRRPVGPWQLFVGDAKNWRMPLSGGVGGSSAGAVTVSLADKNLQGDARKVEWSGTGEGQVYFQSQAPRDLRPSVASHSALLVDVKVDTPPAAAVSLRMDCGYPCGARGDITRILRQVPVKTWARLSIDLKCFTNSGLNAERLDTPLLISTSGKMTLSFASVAIVPRAGPTAAISCSRQE